MNHGDVGRSARKALSNFSVLVHVTVSPDRQSSRRIQYLTQDEVLVKGRCRDYSALLSCGGSSSDEVEIQFVCILRLMPPASSVSFDHKLQLTSAHDALATHTVDTTIKLLTETFSVSTSCRKLLICGDSVTEEVQQLLAKHNIYLVLSFFFLSLAA